MGAAPYGRRRLELGSTHRALVVAALIFNAALLALAVAGGEPRDVLYVLVFGAPPAILLALQARPRSFRLLAGLLGLVYVMSSVVAFFVGGVLFALTGLLLLCAALCPSPVAPPR
jgi:hypothetical protein